MKFSTHRSSRFKALWLDYTDLRNKLGWTPLVSRLPIMPSPQSTWTRHRLDAGRIYPDAGSRSDYFLVQHKPSRFRRFARTIAELFVVLTPGPEERTFRS